MLIFPNTLHESLFKLVDASPLDFDSVNGAVNSLTLFVSLLTKSAELSDRTTCLSRYWTVGNNEDRKHLLSTFLIALFDDGIKLQSSQGNHYLRVIQTYDDVGELVWEIDSITRGLSGFLPSRAIEYFDRSAPIEVVQALQCRVGIEPAMYSGLENRGNNRHSTAT